MTYFIGIDPSTSSTGYAVLDEDANLINKGVFLSKADNPVEFNNLYNQLVELLQKYQPKGVICEQQFFGRNVQTTIKLARPTGLVLSAVGTLTKDGELEPEFEFLNPKSWRKIYHTGTKMEKKYSKKESFVVTQERYPGVVTNFKKENDISDAIGLAYASWSLYNESQDNG